MALWSLVAIPRSLDRGPIEVPESSPSLPSCPQFRDHLIAAPLKLHCGAISRPHHWTIRRSPDRGPIEGAIEGLYNERMLSFRDHLIAAPLKVSKVELPVSSAPAFRDHLI